MGDPHRFFTLGHDSPESELPRTPDRRTKAMRMEQTLCLRGANFKVKWELAEYESRDGARSGRAPAPCGPPRPHRL